ncbi:murein biosynthesis integral membrane protein MurJ [Ponticaulis sp.]|uniref:murein biosynthesis integral membrane protein MurJ n=1 Tax=Ponticaulis sp. TaxID=2020902 RepID=UPI000B675BFF|nr:murein biosynthesis integral membrane protein MurJ [Ponticaulis sp.]MAI91076.1 murein biosynthesis integral membrane protein MurJ [Ponticaulis sp.]OUX98403.1 MAG: murein biosynthesis integral membrane protein MurJ [Hyphomonadaceae bacterium TMED5]
MSLVRNTLVQSSLTLVSRVLGFTRDVLLAARIGAGPIGDAWTTALMFPNLFRRIFAEGAFASAFVPSYSRTLEADGPEAAAKIAEETMRVLFALTAGLTLIAQFAMPWLLLLVHGGQADDPENFDLAILLTRITMPYLTCMSIAALLSGVLNSAGRFFLSAFAPTLLNICLITAAFVSVSPVTTAQAAAIATLIAGVLQAALLYWGVRRQNVRLSLLGMPRITPGVRRVMALAVPGTIAASGTQINIIVSQSLASFEVGAKTWLYYADRLYQLPLGLVGVAVGVAILPRLSRAARSEDPVTSRATMDEGIGLALALTLPAAAALGIAPAFLIEGIFTRGAFLTTDANNSGLALVHYAWGVPAFVMIKVLAPAYFAHEDTKTPMAFALWSVAINTILGAGLFFWLKANSAHGFPGLAIATSTAAWVNVIMLMSGLIKRGWYVPGPKLVSRLIRTCIATALMAAGLLAVLHVRPLIEEYIFDSKLFDTLVFIAFGMAIYGISALITGAVRLSDLKGLVRRRAVE